MIGKNKRKNLNMQPNLDNLITVFNKMSSDGWDINSPLKYGFYFIDSDKEKLEAVYEELREKNYLLEYIHQIDNDDQWTLYASKVDILSPDKLHKRNIAFNELANYFDIEGYDGWDVEQIS
jgi:Regulator of ribonuclease activity B